MRIQFLLRLFLTITIFVWCDASAQERDSTSRQVKGRRLSNPPIPIEIFAGDKEIQYQLIISKKDSPEGRFGFFNVSTFAVDYDNAPQSRQFVNLSTVNCELLNGLSIAAGAIMHFLYGIRPTAGIEYVYTSRKWVIIAFPRVDLNASNNLEVFALTEYKPSLTKTLSLYTRIQVLYNQIPSPSEHDRSYLYLRIGFSYRNYQGGLGANFDRYGPFKRFQDNYGAFVRLQLFN